MWLQQLLLYANHRVAVMSLVEHGCGPVNQSVRWQLSERRVERFGIRGSRASLISKLLFLATACILPPNPHSHFCWT